MDRSHFLKLIGLSTIGFAMTNLNELNIISKTFSNTKKMPVLFIGHGNPMNAIEENIFVEGFRKIASQIEKPNAVLCISAHWLTNGTKVTSMPFPQTIHDFGGFPDELFQVQYPAKGSPELAHETKSLLTSTDIELDEKWGLDHGSWSILRRMYPEVDIPVIQLSIDYSKPMQWHFDLARNLNALRSKGVLIIGSGNIIHNLRLVDFQNMNKIDYGFDWAIEARSTFNDYLLSENFDAIINYDKGSTALKMAVPTPDHFIPLLYTLGLKEKTDQLSLFNDNLVAGSLSMTSVLVQS
jgi:4,5-DOPA dioxygenase extradiol